MNPLGLGPANINPSPGFAPTLGGLPTGAVNTAPTGGGPQDIAGISNEALNGGVGNMGGLGAMLQALSGEKLDPTQLRVMQLTQEIEQTQGALTQAQAQGNQPVAEQLQQKLQQLQAELQQLTGGGQNGQSAPGAGDAGGVAPAGGGAAPMGGGAPAGGGGAPMGGGGPVGGPAGGNGATGGPGPAGGPAEVAGAAQGGPITAPQGEGNQAAADYARQFIGKDSYTLKGQMNHFTAAGGKTNNCADFVSSALESTGGLKGHFVGVKDLEKNLQKQGYHRVSGKDAQPGDVWMNSSRGHTELVGTKGATTLIGSNNIRPGFQRVSEKPNNPNTGVYYHRDPPAKSTPTTKK